MKLLIVESPHKAQTISQWLDKNEWVVFATAGHIKNLPDNDYGIDTSFNGNWEIISSKKKLLNQLKQLIKEAKDIFIGTDDDREGERIAYDLIEYFQLKDYYRVIFHEITKKALTEALKNAIYLDEYKVNSQKARRLIDRIIGYPISNAIKYYFKKETSFKEEDIKKIGIGRVSAGALAVIVEQEKTIKEFIPQKYKKLFISYMFDGIIFKATNNIKFTEDNENELIELYNIVTDPTIKHTIIKYDKKTNNINPPAPLTTSKLLRNINYIYNYNPKDIMKILQKLYDGIEINNKRIGLITYPRTDSLILSDTAFEDLLGYVNEKYQSDYIVDFKRIYKNNSNSQEAHECIRPTNINVDFEPDRIKKFLTDEEFNIYEYIFFHTLTQGLVSSVYDTSSIYIDIGNNRFIVNGYKRIFDGWEILKDKLKINEEDEDKIETSLPSHIDVGTQLSPLDISIIVRDEKTPPRYGVGRFLTTLEKLSIGRPSTLADIIPSLEKKSLINIKKNMIFPTTIGIKLYEFLKDKGNWLVDIELTKKFEEELDNIEKGADYTPLVVEYNKLKDEFLANIGFKDNNNWLIEKVKQIAKENNIPLDDETLNDKDKLSQIYQNYLNKNIITKCICKKGNIIVSNDIYKCNKCKYILPKNNIINFFNNFNKNINNINSFIKQIFTYKKVYIFDLYSNKKNKNFNAFVTIFKSKEKFFNLQLDFKQYKTIDKKYVFADFTNNNTDNKEDDGFIKVEEVKIKQHTPKEIEKFEEEKRLLEEKAFKDPLTRAYNRNKFDLDITHLKQHNLISKLILAFIDGDKFKSINDTYGHQAGDEVLKFIVNSIYKYIKDKQINLYRYGGEEFILLSLETKETTLNIIENIRKYIENSIVEFQEHKIKFTISSGVSFGCNDIEELIKEADDNVYIAKEKGRNQVVVKSIERGKEDEIDIDW